MLAVALSLHYRIVGRIDLVDLFSLPIDLDHDDRVHRNRFRLESLRGVCIEVEVVEGRESVLVVLGRE